MQNTLLSYQRQLELVSQGLATVSTNGNLSTFKYAKKVMYDYMWDKNPDLLEVRGHTYDNQTGELVVAAPRKTFNYLENGTWKDVPLDTQVKAYKKANGFMSCVSAHNETTIVSTTGSTKSDFVGYAKEMFVQSYEGLPLVYEDITFLFEIIHPLDPHIVKEDTGAIFLGYRNKKTGNYIPVFDPKLNYETDYFEGTLKDLLALNETTRTEGWMVYSAEHGVCKLKTPYYVGKKKLMRQNKHAVSAMYNHPLKYAVDNLPLMWGEVPSYICRNFTQEQWLGFDEQFRRLILETLKG